MVVVVNPEPVSVVVVVNPESISAVVVVVNPEPVSVVVVTPELVSVVVVVNPESVSAVVVIDPDAVVAGGGSAHPEHIANSMSLGDKITRADLSAANSIPKLTVSVCSSSTATESESKSFENVSRKSVKSIGLPSTSSH